MSIAVRAPRAVLPLVLLAACGLAWAAVIAADDGPPTERALLPAALDEHPGVPFALPVSLPGDVRLLGTGPSATEDGAVAQRQVEFLQGDRMVSVCSERAPALRCQADAPGGVVRREVDGVAVTIAFTSPGTTRAERALWADLPLTTEIADLRW